MVLRPVLLMLLLGSAHAASFDCAKAATQVERLICKDDELSQLDETLSETFALETEREAVAPRLTSAQRAWLTARNRCPNAQCVKQRYEERISELACDKDSRMAGSAIGSNLCSSFQLRLLEMQLTPLLETRAKQVLQSSNNPEYAKRVLAEEEKAWREYRRANCALHGETEGGSDGWKNAFAGFCEIDETKKRIADLTKEAK